MTGLDMNALHAKKLIIGLLGASVLSGLGGCAASLTPETEAASPVAPRVQALVDANRAYPRWENFPRSSEPLPEPVEVAARVGTLRTASSDLAAATARIEWQEGDPADLVREVNDRIDAQAIAPVTAETQAELDAFVARARARATPPPPVDRGPPPR